MKKLWLATFTLLLWSVPSYAQEICPDGNLIAGKQPVEWLGVYDVSRITDGVVSPEGDHWGKTTNAPLTRYGYLVYDLGARVTITSIYLQVNGSSGFRIAVSDDGEAWKPLEELSPADSTGMIDRLVSSLSTPARYLRISPGEARGAHALGEVAVWCRPPAGWPPPFDIRQGATQDAQWWVTREARLGYAKLACLIVAAGLLLLASHDERRGRWIYAGIALLGGLAWTNFGTFHGNAAIHYHEHFHYYLGSQYFDENGYTGLYACTMWAEKELGLEAVARERRVTDLATNRVVPASELLETEPACRARFDEARWRAFREDVRFFHNSLYPGDWRRIFRDHGYNATPVWTLLGRVASARGPASSVVPRLIWIDVVLWLAIGVSIVWGFGWRELALVFLTLGCGLPWQFAWTGGAFARTPWLFCLVAGVCLLKRRRLMAGGFLLGTAGLLRVFPVLFLGVLGFRLLVTSFRRCPARDELRVLAGVGTAIVLLGGASLSSVGGEGWVAFADNLAKHAGTPTGNLMGLPTIVAFEPASSLSGPLGRDLGSPDRWRRARIETLRDRQLITSFLAVLTIAAMAWTVLRRRWPVWEWIVAATLPAVTLVQLNSYYYVFLILLVPWVLRRPVRIALLFACLGTSQIIGLVRLELDARFLWLSVVFVALPWALWISRMLEPPDRGSRAPAAARGPTLARGPG